MYPFRLDYLALVDVKYGVHDIHDLIVYDYLVLLEVLLLLLLELVLLILVVAQYLDVEEQVLAKGVHEHKGTQRHPEEKHGDQPEPASQVDHCDGYLQIDEGEEEDLVKDEGEDVEQVLEPEHELAEGVGCLLHQGRPHDTRQDEEREYVYGRRVDHQLRITIWVEHGY